jgi:GAF domain-containing protein/HAMP domain-containing protein
MIGAQNSRQAYIPTLLLAMISPAISLMFFMTAVAIVKQEWLTGRFRWFWWLVYLFALVPSAVTILDVYTGSRYWFSGIPSDYKGGFIPLAEYTTGSLASSLYIISFIGLPLLAIILLGYFAILHRRISPNNRRLAWLLLIASAAATAISLLISPMFIPATVELIPMNILTIVAGLAAFQQMVAERHAQRGSLQARLTAMIVVVTIPLLLAVSLFITWRTGAWLDESSRQEIFITLAVGTLLLLILSWLTIHQAIQPIEDLTKTASGIATGDLTRVATVQSEDEIGALARAFNSMTTQLRESITNLERRVAERTRDMERRAIQLQVAAEVANQAAGIRDLTQLLDHTVRLISERFNFYHAGLFLIDENEKFAVLRAASSEGGLRMLARGHKLGVGQVGIVGYVAGKGEPRIALDVGADAVFFNNPDLPQTRSEMALPLKVRDTIIGVLDVQSTKPSAFTDEDVEILQILADQIALAIENAKLISESQRVIQELDALYQMQVSRSWQRRLEIENIAYSIHQGKVERELSLNTIDEDHDHDPRLLQLPIMLRNQSLGKILLRRNPEALPWSPEETEFATEIVNQLALSLENARLLEENRRRAQNEELLGNVSAKTQGLLDVETVIKSAVEEIGRSLGLAKVQIRLGGEELLPQHAPATGEGGDLDWDVPGM